MTPKPETTHTPGPWVIWTGSSWRRIGSETTGKEVAVPIVCHTDGHPDILFPNGGADGPDALLLAAAPDLYEACQKFVESFKSLQREKCDVAHAMAVAALLKAEGRR